jgi:hypothetical protein
LKNACGVPLGTYRDGFLTIESGKTLTFIVGEFLNDLACRQGLGKEKRKCGFHDGRIYDSLRKGDFSMVR